MKLFFNLFVLITFTTSSLYANEPKKGIGQQVKDHFYEHGKGQFALEQVIEKDKQIGSLTEALKVVSQDNQKVLQANTNAVEGVAGAIDNNTGAVNAQTGVLQEGMNNIETPLKIIAACGTIVTATTSLFGFYKYFWPSKEEVKAKEMEQEKLEEGILLSRAKKALNKCLVHNSQCPKTSKGMPIACKAQSDAFAEIAGHDALNKVSDAYNLSLQ